MRVVAVLAQKGGAGKTTVALSLAVSAQRSGASAAIVDLDPQATAAKWGDRRQDQPPSVLSAQPARLTQVLRAAERAGADLIVIDTPPRAEQAGLVAAQAADLVVMPCRPAIFDLQTVETTLDLVRMAGKGSRALAVFNAVAPTGTELLDALEILHALGVPVAGPTLGHRKAFQFAAIHGQSVEEHDATSKAAEEVAALYRAVTQALEAQS